MELLKGQLTCGGMGTSSILFQGQPMTLPALRRKKKVTIARHWQALVQVAMRNHSNAEMPKR